MNIQNLYALTTGQKPLTAIANLDSSQRITDARTETESQDVVPSTPDEVVPDATTLAGEEFSTFLTLLTAQISNQDPLAPLDSTQFVEQLASFTSLELQAKGNQTLERLASMMAQQIYQDSSYQE